jgi:hypothetical protein
MASIAQRVAKAKKRASALSGETFPEWEDEQRGTSGGGEEAN